MLAFSQPRQLVPEIWLPPPPSTTITSLNFCVLWNLHSYAYKANSLLAELSCLSSLPTCLTLKAESSGSWHNRPYLLSQFLGVGAEVWGRKIEKFEASLGYVVRPCLKKKNEEKGICVGGGGWFGITVPIFQMGRQRHRVVKSLSHQNCTASK